MTLSNYIKIAREKPDVPLERLSRQHIIAKSRDDQSVKNIFISQSKACEQHKENMKEIYDL